MWKEGGEKVQVGAKGSRVQGDAVLSRSQTITDFVQLLAHVDFPFPKKVNYWMRAIALLTSTIAPPNHAA